MSLTGPPSVPHERWQRMKQVFAAALEQAADQRERHVADACADDPQLGREVRDMLRAYAIEDGFIQQPAAEHLGWGGELVADQWIGRRIGPYRIVAEAGRGGLGLVFRAVRDDGEVEQQVAIKLLHAGLGTDALLARFRTERRILARLNHPHIAHFLDGGATDDGTPFLAMEFVEGAPIDEYCETHALDLESRLQLVRDLCSAVHHVHQNLLVHGDIKGGNVLVTRDGLVKLLDFGIAKLLDPVIGDTARPATLLMLTPQFASPEQRRGESLTTASDVYSLGALLYVLLAGTTVQSSQAGKGALGSLNEPAGAPMAPSVAAAQSNGSHAGFARALRGDLDTIVLKALKHEPHERYGSAEQLADDIQRFLLGFPIEARPDSAAYRIRKFAQRNAAAAVASGLLVVALIGGTAVALWQAHEARVERERAERHFETVRQLSAAFLGDVYDAISRIPGSTSARKLLVDHTLEYLEGLERDAPDSVELRRDLGSAWEKLADVQGAFLLPSLGQRNEAFVSYRKSIAIREALVREQPTLQHRGDLLAVQVGFAEALLGGDLGNEAHAVFSAALANAEAILALNPGAPVRRKAAATYMNHGWLEWSQGRADSAMASLQKAQTLYHGILTENPGDKMARRDMAVVAGRIGQAQLDGKGQSEAALKSYQRTVEILDALIRDVPDDIELQRSRAYGEVTVGQIYVILGQPREALSMLEPVLPTLERWRKADAADVMAPYAVGAAQNLLGEARVQLGEFQVALAHFAEASKYLTPDLADSIGDLQILYGQRLAGQAQAEAGTGRAMSGAARTAQLAQAYATAQRAIAVLEPLSMKDGNRREATRLLIAARSVLEGRDAAMARTRGP